MKLVAAAVLVGIVASRAFATPSRQAAVSLDCSASSCACVFETGNAAALLRGSDATAAFATYADSVNSTGWGVLTVTSGVNTSWNGSLLAFAAGCAEAAVTQPEIFAYWSNYAAAEYGPAGPSTNLSDFVLAQMAWTRESIAAAHAARAAARGSSADDTFWHGMALVMAQFDGLVAGYAAMAPPEQVMSQLQLYLLNSVGDLEDLNGLFATAPQPRMPLRDKLLDCSAFIRVLPDNSDVVAGHTTWRSYYAMLRTYKLYDLAAFLPSGQPASFSSSPGLLHSKDDFYVVPPLITMETTNSVFNRTLYELYITPNSSLSWQRAWVANFFASDAASWTALFATHNSGTYNNQWMVLDTRAFARGAPPPAAGALYILEQIPGTAVAADVSPLLAARGAWASYNIPFLPQIYNASGYPAMVARYGAQYTYDNCSRARIFARNGSDVRDAAGARSLLRYNAWQTDPLAGGDPILGAVSSRGDLRPGAPVAFGGIDTKVVSAADVREHPRTFQVLAESGPTHDQQAVFVWDAQPAFANIQRDLVPAAFAFNTVPMMLPADTDVQQR